MSMADLRDQTVLCFPPLILCVAVVPEPEVEAFRTHAGLLPTLSVSAEGALHSARHARRLRGPSLSQGARGAMFLFFAGIALALPHWGEKLLLLYFISGRALYPGVDARCRGASVKAQKRFSPVTSTPSSRRRSCSSCRRCDLALATVIVLLISGVNYGAPAFLLRSMMADISDVPIPQRTWAPSVGRQDWRVCRGPVADEQHLDWAYLSVAIAFGAFGVDRLRIRKIVNSPAAIENMRLFYVQACLLVCGTH